MEGKAQKQSLDSFFFLKSFSQVLPTKMTKIFTILTHLPKSMENKILVPSELKKYTFLKNVGETYKTFLKKENN